MPSSGSFGGHIGYTLLNRTTLRAPCWAMSAKGALRLLQSPRCAGEGLGPIPFVYGMLELMSADVQAWTAARSGLAADPRHRCQYEDPLLGWVVSERPQLSLVNLGTTFGGLVDFESSSSAQRAQAMLVNHVRTANQFASVVSDFRQRASVTAAAGGGTQAYCARRTSATSRFCDGAVFRLHCQPWKQQFASIMRFPCCQEWDVCFDPPARRPPRKASKSSTFHPVVDWV